MRRRRYGWTFFYDAPGQAGAEALGEFLRRETDYDVDAPGIEEGVGSEERWSVTGSTQPTVVSLEVLDQWVGWMVAAGAENGGCEFDGWGPEARLPVRGTDEAGSDEGRGQPQMRFHPLVAIPPFGRFVSERGLRVGELVRDSSSDVLRAEDRRQADRRPTPPGSTSAHPEGPPVSPTHRPRAPRARRRRSARRA